MKTLNEYLAENPDLNKKTNFDVDFAGEVVSEINEISKYNSLYDFYEKDRKAKKEVADKKAEEFSTQEIELKGLMKGFSTEMDDPNYTPTPSKPPVKKEAPKEVVRPENPFIAKVKAQNERVKVANMSELQRSYYTKLKPEAYQAKEDLSAEMRRISSDENNYVTVYSQIRDGMGGTKMVAGQTITREAEDEIKALKRKYNEIVRPVHEAERDIVIGKLEEINRKLEESSSSRSFKDKMISTLSPVAPITQGLIKDRKLKSTKNLYEKSLNRLEANLNGKGAWGAILDNAASEDFQTAGIASMADAISLFSVARKAEKKQELSDSDIELLKAYDTSNSVTTEVDAGGLYNTFDNVMMTIPWMMQMAGTSGVGTAAKGSIKLGLFKALKSSTGRILKTGIKPKTLLAATKVITRGGSTIAAPFVQSVAMPATYADGLERYLGDIDVKRDKEGNFVGASLREDLYEEYVAASRKEIYEIQDDPNSVDEKGNLTEEALAQIEEVKKGLEEVVPKSVGNAVWGSVANNALELLVEKAIGSRVSGFFKKVGLRDPLDMLPESKATRFLDNVKDIFGYNGFTSELIEEEVIIPANAIFIGDSKFSDLWDGHQQKELILQVAATGMLMGAFGFATHIPGRIKNRDAYRERRETLRKFRELRDSDPDNIVNIIDFASNNTDLVTLVRKQEELIKDGKKEEAKVLGEKIFYNQMMVAFKTNTVDDFQEALEVLSTKKGVEDGTRENINSALVDLQNLKKVYERYKKLPNSNTIIRLQGDKLMAKKAIREMDSQISELSEDAEADIKAFAANSKFDIPSIPIANLFSKEYEASLTGEQKKEYEDFLDRLDKEGILSVQTLAGYQSIKNEAVNFERDSRILFNEQTSPQFQKKVKDENRFNRAIQTNKDIKKAFETNDQDLLDKAFKEVEKSFKGILSENRKKEIIEDWYTRMVKEKAIENMVKQREIIKTAQQEAGETVETTEKINEKIDKVKKDDTDLSEEEKEFQKHANSFEEIFKIDDDGKVKETEEAPISVPDTSEATVVEEEKSFFDDLPKVLAKMSEAQKLAIGESIKGMYQAMQSKDGKKPTFQEFVKKYAEKTTPEQAEEYYNMLSLGWELNNFAKTNFVNAYKEIFDPFKAIADKMMNPDLLTEEERVETRETVSEDNKKTLKEQEAKDAPVVGFDENGLPIRKPGEMKTISSDLKLGFLALRYIEEDTEQGLGNKTTDTELRENGLVWFKELLHPDKYGVGTELSVRIPPPEVLAKTYITYLNKEGKKVSITYPKWLANGIAKNPAFESSQEYIDSVPIMAYNSENIPVAYIHDVNWYNTSNIGFQENPAMQATVIQEGKEEVSEFRTAIFKDGVNSIEIHSKDGAKYQEIPKSAKALTLQEANPDAEIAVAMDRGILMQGAESFENKNRVLTNGDKLQTGHAYDVRRIGTNKDGQETWTAYKVLRKNADGTEGLNDEMYNNVRWALAAFLKNAGYNSNFKSNKKVTKNIEISEEQAENIIDKVLKETGYDVSNLEDLIGFMSQYIYIEKKNIDFTEYSNLFFNEDSTEAKARKVVTNNDAVGGKPNMVSINEAGEVNNLNKNYVQYMKDYLTTTIKSFNVGTTENPVYATVVQPAIVFGYKKKDPIEVENKEEISKEGKEIKKEVKDAAEKTEVEKALEKANKLLNNLGLNKSESFDMPKRGIMQPKFIEDIFSITDGLTIQQEGEIIDYIFNNISKKISIEKGSVVSKGELLSQMKESYNDTIKENLDSVLETLKTLEDLYASTKDESLIPAIKEYQKVRAVYQNIKLNWENIENKALEKLYKYTGIKEGTLNNDGTTKEDVEVSQRVKDYSKSSLEEDSKGKTSYRLRRFFAGITQMVVDKDSPNGAKVKKGFLGLPTYVGFNEVYDTIAQILSSPVETESDYQTMIAKLKASKEAYKWLPEVIANLEKADSQLQKEFVYTFAKHPISMKFAMYSVDGNGNYTLKIFDTNANEITRQIKKSWRNNLNMTPLVVSEEGEYGISKEKAAELQKKMKEWGDDAPNVNTELTRKWLTEFGITFSDDAWKEISTRGVYTSGDFITYSEMFTSKKGVFRLLDNYLTDIQKAGDTKFESNENNHPHTDMGNVLQALANLESKYANHAVTLSFRDNGKSIFGLTPNKFVTDRVFQLKNYDEDGNNGLVDELKDISISSESYMLDLLNAEKDFRSKFSIDHVGITALKQQGRKASAFSSVTDLNNIDHDLTKIAGLQDTKQGQVKAVVDQNGNIVKEGKGLSLRMGRMFMPTMSDKSQMLFLNTGVFNFFKDKRKSFEVDSDGKFSFTDTVRNLLFNQLVKPELKRIAKFNAEVKRTNIEGYDAAAKIFHYFPSLNNIKNEKGQRIIELMAISPDVYTVEKIEELFRDQIDAVLKKSIDSKVEKKMEQWQSALEIKEDGSISKIKFWDKTYLNQTTGSLEEKFKLGMYDFVMNSMLSNSSMYNIIAGDPAVYSSDKLFNNFGVDNLDIIKIATIHGKGKLFKAYGSYKEFKEDLNRLYEEKLITKKLFNKLNTDIKPDPTQGTDKQYLGLSKTLGVNLGKRLALLIAPGNKLANSKNGKYMQIFLKDQVGVAENIEYLIELYYGKEALNKVSSTLDTAINSTEERVKEEAKEKLAKKFPEIKKYLFIPSTDAQEYTTLNEHLKILEDQGRIEDFKLVEIRKALEEGRDLTKKELEIVLQPIKPVYTGQILDKEQDVTRTVYIKSSSFPLIPQMTKGRGLEGLRVEMERIEKESPEGMTVRASYQTANKVGAMNNPIDPFNPESLATAEASSLILDRNNFRIQQDVPFKSDLKKQDTVSMGTQMFKLLFGDGMLDQEGFMFNGETVSGRKLYDKFNDTFGNLIDLKKRQLYRELGLDKNGIPVDELKSAKKLQDLLKKEAIKRGYPRQDVEGLNITEQEINGNTFYDFDLPLWLSSNSNRYEALLNAIVTNRIIKQKMPGSSFVIGSEAGMKVTESKDGIQEASKIITIGDHDGGDLKGVRVKDGKFISAEIYLPSKFKDNNGKLIDLYEKVNNKYKYLDETPTGLKLKEGKIDPELLNNFTFRTPSSAHVSGSTVKVVGFLPPINGDLMIVPMNFIPQKGLDFDIDKETAYQLWTAFNKKTGKLDVFNRTHKEQILKRKKEILDGKIAEDPNVDAFFASILGDTYDEIMEDKLNSNDKKLEALEDELEQKILENDIVKINIAVYSNPNSEVQKKINKVLSMDFASSQADFIEELQTGTVDDSNFTILDDDYQKSKMGLGSAGKLAIGVYSNYVTFHSLSQQVNEPLFMAEKLEDDSLAPKTVTIGNFTASGMLGEINTLDGSRSITEVLAEKQNTATDNEKEQILGRVNVNGTTINVDSLLTLLGFDKGENLGDQETSIPYLFLSQPILVDYVRLTQESKGITSEYDANREEKIIEQLIQKYGKNFDRGDISEGIISDEDFNGLMPELTSEKMVSEISDSKNGQPGLQLAVLRQFLELNEYARNLSGVQSILNTTSLGKSIIESNDKLTKLENLGTNSMFANVDKLIGDYIPISDTTEQPEGYTLVGDFWVMPTTPQGKIVVNGVAIGNNLWNKYFPYSDPYINSVMAEILEITEAKDMSETRKLELKFQIFKEMKKYINSDYKNGLFDDIASVERDRLFIDRKGNTSLANYMNQLKNIDLKNVEEGKKEGAEGIKKDRLFTKFTYNTNTNGEPSTIFFNNSAKENFDEDYLYSSIGQMYLEDKPLPDKDGKPYSTRDLAMDLVAYSYVEGGVQEAIQFAKYIPIEYLKATGTSTVLQNYSPKRDNIIFHRILGIKNKTKETSHLVSVFTKQFVQHNPDKATQYPPEMEQSLFQYKNKDNFFFKGEDHPKFISKKNKTKSKRKQDKFSLYQHIGNGNYQRISILGAHGMNEYEMGNDNNVSLLDKAAPAVVRPQNDRLKGKTKEEISDVFDIGSGDVTTVLNNIVNFPKGKYRHFNKLIKFLLPHVKSNVKVVIADTSEAGTKAAADGRTSVDGEGNITITMDINMMKENNFSHIAKVFVHEFVHTATALEIRKYFNKDGEQIVKTLPRHVARLKKVFEEVEKELGPELIAFKKKRAQHENGELPSSTAYTKKELEVLYGGSNIAEFLTIALTEPAFQKRLAETPFMQSGESMWTRLKDVVINILASAGVPIEKNSVTYESLVSILDFIEIEGGNNTGINKLLKLEGENRYTPAEKREIRKLNEEGDNVEDSEFTKIINHTMGSLDLPKTQSNKDAIDNIFEENPVLQKMGRKEQYSQYLAGVAIQGENPIKVDIKGFENYLKGLTPELLNELPDICN